MKRWLGRRLIAWDRLAPVHWVLGRVMSRAIAMRFVPAAAEGLEATLELELRDPHGRPSSHYRLAIAQGHCSVQAGGSASISEAAAVASIGSDDLILLATGAVGWPELFSSGRFELTGDPFLALRFASLFRLPVVLDPV